MTIRRRFAGHPTSVREARLFAAELAEDLGPEGVEVLTLMVSELASNCVRHAESPFEIAITRTGPQLRVEVTDRGGGRPRMRAPGPTEPSGRGLRIVDMFSTQWGVEADGDGGKTVWFCMLVEDSNLRSGASEAVRPDPVPGNVHAAAVGDHPRRPSPGPGRGRPSPPRPPAGEPAGARPPCQRRARPSKVPSRRHASM
ncbi:MAG: putative sensor protein [Acidimicrobiales bacterium]|nr:putative sensor protein [Acidimicrobiales bacterium]